MTQQLSAPVNFQMRLPVGVLEKLREESRRTMIPLNLLVRRVLLEEYGSGVSFVSENSRNPTVEAEKLQ